MDRPSLHVVASGHGLLRLQLAMTKYWAYSPFSCAFTGFHVTTR